MLAVLAVDAVDGAVTADAPWVREERRAPDSRTGRQMTEGLPEKPYVPFLRLGIWYRVHAVAAKGMAPRETSAPQPDTAPRPMQTDSFRHVVRAGGVKPADPVKSGEEAACSP